MPINTNPYGPIVESMRGLATLGDIASYRERLNDQKSLRAERDSVTAFRNQEVSDRQRTAQDQAQRQALIQSIAPKHLRQDGSLDQTGFLNELASSGDLGAYQAVAKSLHETNATLLEEQKAQREQQAAQSAQVEELTRGIDQDRALAAINLPKIKALRPDIADYIGDGTDPIKVQHVRQQAMTFENYQKDLARIDKEANTTNDHVLAQIAAATTPDQAHEAFLTAHHLGTDHVLDKYGIRPDTYNPATDRPKVLSLMSGVTADKVAELMAPPKQANGDYSLSPGQKRFNAQNQEVASVAPRPVAQSGSGAAASGANDAKDIAAAIMRGDQPPTMTGLYGKTAAVKGELARSRYDLTKATEDWNATSRYLTTLNGAQQVRLRQAVEFTRESLPTIRGLVSQWDSAGLPVLSKATLDSAAAGTFGQKQQSLAVRLKGQIADLQSELGTVYKGGNSSTDESLKLAAENLQGQWSKKAALDAIDQIERNLTIRSNSIKNTGVVGNADNAYAPKGATSGAVAPPTGRYNPATGKVEPVK